MALERSRMAWQERGFSLQRTPNPLPVTTGLSRPAADDQDTEAAGTAQVSALRMCET